MATDVDVQYFSHLNGLVLGNNWGDLIRLLDKALVTGVDFTQITAASIDAQGDVHLTLFAPHKALLLQVVELTDFEPLSLNQKYRIKGVPSPTQLILKPQNVIAETAVTTKGTGKLASLGYDIIFRDNNDVKRVYRAKNPTAQHPFIRVDESLTSPDGTSGVYASTYAKSAMVGLLENMSHIDDYQDTSKLQLPLDITDFTKNWKINGTGTAVVRGWSRWYWARSASITNPAADLSTPGVGNRGFTLIGDVDAFYIVRNVENSSSSGIKSILGCGIYNSSLKNDVIPNWFIASILTSINTGTNTILGTSIVGSMPLGYAVDTSKIFVPNFSEPTKISNHVTCDLITPDYQSGFSNIFSANNVAALEIPLKDPNKYLRGTLKHINYNGKLLNITTTTTYLSESSMYVADGIYVGGQSSVGSPIFYLGELE